MNGREYNVNEETCESKWAEPGQVTIKKLSSLPVGPILVKPHAYGSQLFLLPTVLGTLEPARKLLRSGHRLGHEFCAALPAFFALHRSRILFDRLTSRVR